MAGPFERGGMFGGGSGFERLVALGNRAQPELFDFYESPLTTELFDRTPEQRKATTLQLNEARVRGEDVSTVAARNAVLFEHFAWAVHDLIAEQIGVGIAGALVGNAQEMDRAAIDTIAEATVRAKLAELHTALPLPALDRLVEAQA